MAEEQQFFRQYLRSKAEDGSETVREVVSPSLLDEAGARAAETQAGRTFTGFVRPEDMPGLGAQAVPPAPPAEAPGLGTRIKEALLPQRSLTSQLPAIGGAIAGGELGAAAGALGGPFAPVTIPVGAIIGAGIGSAGGEAGRVGYERLSGAEPAEAGTLVERVTRAGARGAAGEGIGMPLRLAGAAALTKAGPVLEAAESLRPVLTQQGSAPLTTWWAANAPRGARAVVNAWDDLGSAGQQALAGGQHGAMTTVVDTLRASAEPIGQMSLGSLAKVGAVPTMLFKAGYPTAAAGLGIATEATRRGGPMLLLNPTTAGWLGSLPQTFEAAAPWVSTLARTGQQVGTAEVWPPPVAPPTRP